MTETKTATFSKHARVASLIEAVEAEHAYRDRSNELMMNYGNTVSIAIANALRAGLKEEEILKAIETGKKRGQRMLEKHGGQPYEPEAINTAELNEITEDKDIEESVDY